MSKQKDRIELLQARMKGLPIPKVVESIEQFKGNFQADQLERTSNDHNSQQKTDQFYQKSFGGDGMIKQSEIIQEKQEDISSSASFGGVRPNLMAQQSGPNNPNNITNIVGSSVPDDYNRSAPHKQKGCNSPQSSKERKPGASGLQATLLKKRKATNNDWNTLDKSKNVKAIGQQSTPKTYEKYSPDASDNSNQFANPAIVELGGTNSNINQNLTDLKQNQKLITDYPLFTGKKSKEQTQKPDQAIEIPTTTVATLPNGSGGSNTNLNVLTSSFNSIINTNNPNNPPLHTKSKQTNFGLVENMNFQIQIQQMGEKIVEAQGKLQDKTFMLNRIVEEKKFVEQQRDKIQEEYTVYQTKVQEIVGRSLVELENLQRNELKTRLSFQQQRLGQTINQREGNQFNEVWKDGYEMRDIQLRLNEIIVEKEELEKKMKNIKSNKKSQETQSEGMMTEESISDIDEFKNRIKFQQSILQKEEQSLQQSLEKLENEQFAYIKEAKRLFEEDQYGSVHPSDKTALPWPLIGKKYQLLSLLGKGGFSEVYKGYDLEGLREVALKVHQLNPNWSETSKSNYIKHAIRENQVHTQLKHPNIVRCFDTIQIDPNSFGTVLEYCEGPDLSSFMKKYKNMNEKEAKSIIKQILSALKYLNSHRTKIIHYDLKPQNIMFHKGDIKISDFGLCQVLEDCSRLELTSQGVGTYWYLPPETFEIGDNPPQISSKVDVWSIGVILYELTIGVQPFGNQMTQQQILKEQIILKSTSVNFPIKPQLSNQCKQFIKGCLQYDQEKRFDVDQALNHPFILNQK